MPKIDQKELVFARIFAGIALCTTVGLLAAPATIPDHKSTVTAARAKYQSLSGPKRAYCVVNQTAWDLRSEGAGAFFKDAGSNYLQRSIDIVIYKPAGETFDILGDAEGTAKPQWTRTSPSGFGDPARWRPAVDPATLTVCGGGVTPVPPDPIPVPPTDLTARVVALEAKTAAQGAQIVQLQTDLTTLAARVGVLEHAPPPPAGGCTEQVVNTSTTAFHSHAVKTCLPGVP